MSVKVSNSLTRREVVRYTSLGLTVFAGSILTPFSFKSAYADDADSVEQSPRDEFFGVEDISEPLLDFQQSELYEFYKLLDQAENHEANLTISEYKEFADLMKGTYYMVTGLVTEPHSIDSPVKMYDSDNPEPSRFISVDYFYGAYTSPNYNEGTQEETLCLGDIAFLNDAPLARGYYQSMPKDAECLIDITFDEFYDMTLLRSEGRVTLTGYLAFWFSDNRDRYWFYESADALINEDENARLLLLVDPSVSVKEGSKITIRTYVPDEDTRDSETGIYKLPVLWERVQ